MNNSFMLALSTLIGTIIGAGIFGLPYVVSKSGVVPSIFYFVILGGVVLLLHLFMGEIVLRTTDKHRLIGYAEIYLGAWAKKLVTFSTIVGTVGVLLAYIIISGDFLEIVLGSLFPISNTVFSIVAWLGLSLFILKGIQAIAKMEFFMNIALFSVIGVILLFAAPHIETGNFVVFDSAHLFLPYGIILFAFAGWAAIPEITDLFKNRKEKKGLDNLIVWAMLICGLLYLFFSAVVVGVSGGDTSQDALTGLVPFLGNNIVILGAVFGLIAITASFLVLGNYLKNSLRYDYRFPYVVSAGIAVVTPMILFLLGLREFIVVIGIVGVVMGVIDGTIIVLIYRQAKLKGDRKPEYSLRIPQFVLAFLIIILIAGALSDILLN